MENKARDSFRHTSNLLNEESQTTPNNSYCPQHHRWSKKKTGSVLHFTQKPKTTDLSAFYETRKTYEAEN